MIRKLTQILSLVTLCLASLSGHVFAGGASPIMVELTTIGEAEALTAGIGSSKNSSQSAPDIEESASSNGGFGAWLSARHNSYEAIIGFNRLDGTGREISLGLEKQLTPDLLVGVALSKQDYAIGSSRSQASSYAPYLSYELANILKLDLAYGMGKATHSNANPDQGREFLFAKAQFFGAEFGSLTISPFASIIDAEQDRTFQSHIDVFRYQFGTDIKFPIGNWNSYFRIAWDKKVSNTVVTVGPPTPVIIEQYKTRGYSFGFGGSTQIGNAVLSAKITHDGYLRDADSTSLAVTLTGTF